jgi:hypothetical protein
MQRLCIVLKNRPILVIGDQRILLASSTTVLLDTVASSFILSVCYSSCSVWFSFLLMSLSFCPFCSNAMRSAHNNLLFSKLTLCICDYSFRG